MGRAALKPEADATSQRRCTGRHQHVSPTKIALRQPYKYLKAPILEFRTPSPTYTQTRIPKRPTAAETPKL